MKISAARLKQIIKEELFYREFHREGQELQEVEKAKDERISRKISYLVDNENKLLKRNFFIESFIVKDRNYKK